MSKAMAIALPIALLWGFSGVVQAANSRSGGYHHLPRRISRSGGCAWRSVIQRHSLR